jgi:hypothetical protein
MKKSAAVVLLLSVLLGACHNPKSVTISSDSSKWESELKTSIQQLGDGDRQAVSAFLVRAKLVETFGKSSLVTPGLTIGDAIEQQKKWAIQCANEEAEQDALKAKLLAQQEEIKKQIQGGVTVTVLSKTLVPSNV